MNVFLLVARNAAQALSREPIAKGPSDEEGRRSDQQGWYCGKQLPSLDGMGDFDLRMILEVSMEINLDQIEQQALQALEVDPGRNQPGELAGGAPGAIGTSDAGLRPTGEALKGRTTGDWQAGE